MDSYNNNKSNNKTRNKANKTGIPFVTADTYAYRDLSPKNGTVIRYFIEKNKNELGQRFRVVGVGSDNSPDYSKKPPTIRIPYNLDLIKELIEKKTLKTIIVCEGEKDCSAVQSSLFQDGILDTVATTFSNGVSSIKTNWEYADYWKHVFENKKIAVLRDEDNPGKGYQKNVVELMSNLPGTEVISIALPGAEIGEDVSDWLEGKFASELIEIIEDSKSESWGNLNDFLEEDWEGTQVIIEGLFYEGTNFVIGTPKAGKSQFLASISKAIVDGKDFNGIPLTPVKILSIAMEGSKGNWAKRFAKLNIKNKHLITFRREKRRPTLWSDIKREIVKGGYKVLMIDTITKFDPAALSNPKKGNDYLVQTIGMQKYTDFAEENHIAIVFTHHEGRMEKRAPHLAGLYGSGFVGDAENIICIYRSKDNRSIWIEGRDDEFDVPESELLLDPETDYVYLGDIVASSKAKNISNEIYQYISDSGTAKHQDIIREITGRTDTILASISHLLDNGRIELRPGTPGKEYKVSIPHSDTATGIRNTHTSNSNSNIPTGVTNAEQSSFDEPTPEWNPFAH